MTETGMNLTNPYDGERRPGTVGTPFPGQEARVVDPATREVVPDGTHGEIEVRGPHVFSGYWRRPEADADPARSEQDLVPGPAATVPEDNWPQAGIDFNALVNDFETQLIVQALKLTQGNKKEAARLLNLKRTTLLEKIKKKELFASLGEEEND